MVAAGLKSLGQVSKTTVFFINFFLMPFYKKRRKIVQIEFWEATGLTKDQANNECTCFCVLSNLAWRLPIRIINQTN